MSVFLQLYSMYEEELYSNCHTIAQFYSSNPNLFHISPDLNFAILIIDANS